MAFPAAQIRLDANKIMKFGIFTHYFHHPIETVADRIRLLGLECVQLNMSFKNWHMGEQSTSDDCRRVAKAFTSRNLSIAALSGYRNLVAPDAERRLENVKYIRMLLGRANDLGSPLVVTEAGSRHPHDDWAPCLENGSPAAMHLLIDTLGELIEHARKYGATLVLEPSVGTVIDTPGQIALVSEALPSRSLGFVADWPNLIDGSNIDYAPDILSAMTAPLAGRVLLAHFKDANRVSGMRREVHHHAGNADLYGGVEYPAPGQGSLDLAKYAQWLRTMEYDGAVIIEHVEEAAVPEALGCTRAAFFQGATSQVST